MSDPTPITVDPPPIHHPPPPDRGSDLPAPQLDAAFFDSLGEKQNGVVAIDELDFDFSFDDLCMPSSDDLNDLLNPNQFQQLNSEGIVNPNFDQFGASFDQFNGVFKSTSEELRHLSEKNHFSGDQSWDGSGVLTSDSPEISGYLNIPSPDSNGSNRETCVADVKELNCGSPESQVSGNCPSNVSGDSSNSVARSVSSSRNSNNSLIKTDVVDQKVKLEDSADKNVSKSLLKRKKESEDLKNSNVESRISKYRKSDSNVESNDSSDNNGGLSEEEGKRKARLMRNRESAQLSRQRKKHYVEELEDKIRSMHSTIQDLNSKISYFMAENTTLRQQTGGAGGAAPVPSPGMGPPTPGMYPHPAMMYPWMPCPPPYMMKPQGSQVPLVPIPRLKPQRPAQAPKMNKKSENKKNEGQKTKKVAGVSFLGVLFCIMFIGGLVPMVNVRYGGVREAFTGGECYIGDGLYEKNHGRVLMVNRTEYGDRRDFSSNSSVHGSEGDPSADEFVKSGNGSEPLVASLYVPRNDKLVKIDGNLIIHSVLASEKAMASSGTGGSETGLAVPGDLAPAIPVPGVGRNGVRHPHLMALGSGSTNKDSVKSTASDGKLQQWFREGLAGPMLSAGMCSEVFQFDVSTASGAIIPATTTRNISMDKNRTSMHPIKGRNRRILHSLPIPLPENSGRSSQKEDMIGNKNASSMLVSVLFDPREAGDADVDGVMGTKSITRIFVVLIDSVKYVTYSCMLPFKGSAPHLVMT